MNKVKEFKSINLLPEQLKIGNLVQISDLSPTPYFKPKNNLLTVVSISESGINGGEDGYDEVEYEDLSGIPLTEEWLVKMGFEKTMDYYFKQYIWINSSGFMIAVDSEECTVKVPHAMCGIQIAQQFVHQLQNLFYSLTSEELIVI
jgi:hypothetical protein